MPVGGSAGGECPRDGRPLQARPDMEIVGDVVRVVVVGEGLPVDRIVDRDNGSSQHQAEQKLLSTRREPLTARRTLLYRLEINRRQNVPRVANGQPCSDRVARPAAVFCRKMTSRR